MTKENNANQTTKTPKQWWKETKADETKLNQWLIKQHRGEVTASKRILDFGEKYAPDSTSHMLLVMIAKEEGQHATWISGLLKKRGLTPDTENAEKRYWQATLPEVTSFETGAAVGAHAEWMRLKRIQVICEDDSAPSDIRKVFKKILKDEQFHAKAFREMAGLEALWSTYGAHQRGVELLGLEA
jgi:tRNA isopentenyl-2-thiomethyl-A-37 hydroxylase MiaE